MVCCAALLCAGCRCSDERGAPAPAAAVPSAAYGCERGSAQLTLTASVAAPAPPSEELEPNMELPFSTEVGSGVAVGGDFFATGLRHESRGAVAVLARLSGADASGQVVDIGRLSGNAAPPRLAADRDSLAVALEQPSRAGFEIVRVARVLPASLAAPLAWRDGLEQASGDSNGYDLALAGGHVLLAWDEWLEAEGRGRVLVRLLPLEGQAGSAQPIELSSPSSDAESPRVAARPGGFWVSWLVNDTVRGRARAGDPRRSGERTPNATEPSPYGERHVEIVALGPSGAPLGKVARVTERGARIVGLDLTSGPDGSAWVVWRHGAASPDASGGQIAMATVSAAGARESRVVRADDVGAGEPTWLAGADDVWLTFADPLDVTLLARVGPGSSGAPLELDRAFERASALALGVGGTVLMAAPQGRAVELFSAKCRVAPPGARTSTGDAGTTLAAWPDAGAPRE